MDALPQEHPIKAALYEAIREGADRLRRIRDVDGAVGSMRECEQVSEARVTAIDLGTGLASAVLELPRSLFYETLSQQSGFQIGDDGDLMALLTQLAQVKAKYDKVADALKEVEETGYGIVVPSIDSLVLEEPEIVKQGGRYGVRLKASAPSIHIIWNKKKLRTAKPTKREDVTSEVGSAGLNAERRRSPRWDRLFLVNMYYIMRGWTGIWSLGFVLRRKCQPRVILYKQVKK